MPRYLVTSQRPDSTPSHFVYEATSAADALRDHTGEDVTIDSPSDERAFAVTDISGREDRHETNSDRVEWTATSEKYIRDVVAKGETLAEFCAEDLEIFGEDNFNSHILLNNRDGLTICDYIKADGDNFIYVSKWLDDIHMAPKGDV